MSELHENGFDDFMARFKALANEATSYGINAFVILSGDDPLNKQTELGEIWGGNRLLGIGMLQQALWHLQARNLA